MNNDQYVSFINTLNTMIEILKADQIAAKEPEWEPEVGKLYYFSDLVESPSNVIRRFHGRNADKENEYQFLTSPNTPWKHCSPINPDDLGK